MPRGITGGDVANQTKEGLNSCKFKDEGALNDDVRLTLELKKMIYEDEIYMGKEERKKRRKHKSH